MTLLSKVPLIIGGAWVSRSPWRWEGWIEADQPITGLVLVERASGVSWCRATRSHSGRLPASLSISEEPGMGTHVSWRLTEGDGLRSAWTQPHGSLDEMKIDSAGKTGEPLWLAKLGTSPAIRLGVYLVIEAETASARTGLWRLRRGFDAVSEPWTDALNHARTGEIIVE